MTLTDYVMDDLVEKSKEEKIEELKRHIYHQKKMIKDIERYNPNSGDLSFDYYQLSEYEKELKELLGE